MAFTRDVKLELGTIVPAAEHCRRAQLSGVFFGAGVFELGAGSHFAVRVSLGLPATARHVLALLKPFGVEASLRTDERAPPWVCATRSRSATRTATCSCSTSSACCRTTCGCR